MFLIDSISSQTDPGRARTATIVSLPWLSLGNAALGVFTLSLFLATTGRAQSDADGFNPGANGSVRAFVLQADGKIVVGGEEKIA